MNDESSIWLTNLNGDPNTGTNWKRAGASGDTLSRTASAIFDSVVDHPSGDIGSPGFAPGSVVIESFGDYNDNGAVDAADYVAWRKLFGTTSSLPNDPNVGTTIDQDQYNTWRANFGGTSAGNGSGSDAVPEPTSIAMCVVVLLTCGIPSRGERPV